MFCIDDHPFAGAVLKRICDEVYTRLHEEVGVREHGQILLARHGHGAFDRLSHLVEQTGHQVDVEAGRLLARLRPGEHEERPRDACEPRALVLDVRDEPVPILGDVLRPSLQHVRRTDDAGQRREQLVCRIRDELALRALTPLVP